MRAIHGLAKRARFFVSVCPARCAHGSPLLETFPAVDRAPLGGLEGNCGFLPALRTSGSGFHPVVRTPVGVRTRILSPFGFAGFASLGFIPKTLFSEEHLLASRKNELGTAIGTLQDFIVELHMLLRAPAARGTACQDEGYLRGCPKKTTAMREKVPPCPMASDDELLRTSRSHP